MHTPIPIQPANPLSWGEIPGIEWVIVSIVAIALTAMYAADQASRMGSTGETPMPLATEQSSFAHQTQNNFNQQSPDGFGVSFVGTAPHGQSHGGDHDPAIAAP